ncbi:hypothetical protein [Labrys neptuniae]
MNIHYRIAAHPSGNLSLEFRYEEQSPWQPFNKTPALVANSDEGSFYKAVVAEIVRSTQAGNAVVSFDGRAANAIGKPLSK